MSKLATLAAAAALLVADPNATGSRVERVDQFDLRLDASSVVRHENGMLDVDGIATRVGVFLYDDPSSPAGVFREFRPRAEVLDADSLASLRGVPFTIDHPDGEVTSENAAGLTHGWILDVQPVGDLIRVRVRISTDAAKAAINAGTVELSCGYSARLEAQAGVSDSGEPFDAIQRDIRYNHLALVDLARAGHVARLRLDGFRVQRTDQARRPRTKMKNGKIKIAGKTLEAPGFVIDGLIGASRESRGDQIETGKLTIEIAGDEPAELVLPAATIEQVLTMLGAAPGAEAPAEGDPAEPAEGDAEGEDPAAAAPAAPAAPGAPAEGEETEDQRMDAAAVSKLVDRRVAEALQRRDATERERAEIERRGSRILDSGYQFKKADTWQVMADSVAAVSEADGVKALELAGEARKGNQRAAGRLDGLFDAAERTHRDAADKSGDLLEQLDASAKARADADGEADPVAAARKKRLDRREARSRGEDPDAPKLEAIAVPGGLA